MLNFIDKETHSDSRLARPQTLCTFHPTTMRGRHLLHRCFYVTSAVTQRRSRGLSETAGRTSHQILQPVPLWSTKPSHSYLERPTNSVSGQRTEQHSATHRISQEKSNNNVFAIRFSEETLVPIRFMVRNHPQPLVVLNQCQIDPISHPKTLI